MASNITGNDFDYDYTSLIMEKEENETYLNRIRMLYLVAYAICCTLCLTLNFYVVIISCRVYHKHQEHNTSVWVLALAITHLVFSAFLVLHFFYTWHFFNWQYGTALCKLSSCIFYASMFSTATLLSLWSVSDSIGSNRCLERFRNMCCAEGTSTSIVLVLISWTFGVFFSSPSLFSRELRYTEVGKECIDDYDLDKENTTAAGMQRLIAVVLSRFLLGILVPMAVMTISACVTRRQGQNETYKQVTCAIKVAYFVSWTPLLFLGLVQATTESHSSFLKYGLPAATVLATTHCFINPVIYLLVGSKNMWWRSCSTGGPVVLGG